MADFLVSPPYYLVCGDLQYYVHVSCFMLQQFSFYITFQIDCMSLGFIAQSDFSHIEPFENPCNLVEIQTLQTLLQGTLLRVHLLILCRWSRVRSARPAKHSFVEIWS